MLFHTVALIGEANGEFLRVLSGAVEAASESGVSDAVAQLAEKHLSYYSVFCNHQAEAMADAKRLQRTSDSFVRICEQASAHADANGLALLDFLVKPFQRLLKYPLLLRELIKYTPVGHAARAGLEAAMAKIQTVVDEVDRQQGQGRQSQAHAGAQQPHLGPAARALEPLVTPARRLVREGWVRKISSGNDQERHLALFNDLLVYSKRKGRRQAALSRLHLAQAAAGYGARRHRRDSARDPAAPARQKAHLHHLLRNARRENRVAPRLCRHARDAQGRWRSRKPSTRTRTSTRTALAPCASTTRRRDRSSSRRLPSARRCTPPTSCASLPPSCASRMVCKRLAPSSSCSC
jgi:hypothetical protein